MKRKINLLDCTLRDGAYIVQSQFGEGHIKSILQRMYLANIDIIECGWLKNEPHSSGSSFFRSPLELENYLPQNTEKKPALCLMFDWDRYNINNLPQKSGSVEALRIVFPRGKAKDAAPLIESTAEKGYFPCIQAANTLSYSANELKELAAIANKSFVRSVSIVDTFGAMYPDNLKRIFDILNGELNPDIMLDFHSHNNMQLSFALLMKFIELISATERKCIVDGSLAGMGRGAGNVPLELAANYLNANYGANYNMTEICRAIDEDIEPLKKNYFWGYCTAYSLAGELCAHINNILFLQENYHFNNVEIKQALLNMTPEDRVKYNYPALSKIAEQLIAKTKE